MHKLTLWFATAIATSAIVAGTVAAAPHPGAKYSGRGQEYANNDTHLIRQPGLRESASFTVSANGARMLNFRGKYVYYCGATAGAVTAASLRIRNGGFGGTGHRTFSAGTGYYTLTGHFTDHGKKAAVTYQADFVFTHHHVKHPYSYAYKQTSAACQVQVRATLKAG